MNEPKVSIFIRIDPALKAWLEQQAEKERRSLSDYARMLLEDHRSLQETTT